MPVLSFNSPCASKQVSSMSAAVNRSGSPRHQRLRQAQQTHIYCLVQSPNMFPVVHACNYPTQKVS
jgi:hypothetical protein